ncbi:MAG TPA: TolC family protein, partial [Candidatus Angelobacter sp.]|nr:TolC family protein [Candidatus Angelobacter sp.]
MKKLRSVTVQRTIITVLLLTFGLLAAAAAQQEGSSFELGSIATPRTINPATNSNTPSTLAGQQQNPFLGSVPTGVLSATPIDLSLQDSIERGVHFNLGVIEDQSSLRQAQAQRLRALSALLPNVSTLLRQNLDELNRVAIGLKIPGLPASTGQFSYQESYVAFSENGLNLDNSYRLRAARRSAEAGTYSLADARDVVVLAVGTAYLQVIASKARVETAKAQLDVAKTL